MRSGARLAVACVAAVGLGILIGAFGGLQVVEDRVRLAAALVSRTADPADRRIVIVRITEADYQQMFEGRSPLDPRTLRDVIEAIAAYRPAALGVDVDTSPAQYKVLREIAAPAIVWARNVDLSQSAEDVMPILGYPGVEHEGAAPPRSGVSLLEVDDDGIIRSYQRMVETRHGRRPTFTCALIAQCSAAAPCKDLVHSHVAEACRQTSGDDEPYMIDYRLASEADPSVLRVTAADVVASRALPSADQAVWQERLADKIVILGGAYRASGDTRHATPLGDRDGVDLLAQIVATELRGGGDPPTRMVATGILIGFETYVLVLLARVRPWSRRLIAGAAAIVIFAAAASVMNVGSLWRTPFFGAVLACVAALQIGFLILERNQETVADVISKRWRLFAREEE